jgi:hypothetical protein
MCRTRNIAKGGRIFEFCLELIVWGGACGSAVG